jgi:hypothetical protein
VLRLGDPIRSHHAAVAVQTRSCRLSICSFFLATRVRVHDERVFVFLLQCDLRGLRWRFSNRHVESGLLERFLGTGAHGPTEKCYPGNRSNFRSSSTPEATRHPESLRLNHSIYLLQLLASTDTEMSTTVPHDWLVFLAAV